MTPHKGDLAIIDPTLDRHGLYLELKDSNNKMFYSVPRQVVDPDDLLLVLDVDEHDSLIVTAHGVMGWIHNHALVVVNSVTA